MACRKRLDPHKSGICPKHQRHADVFKQDPMLRSDVQIQISSGQAEAKHALGDAHRIMVALGRGGKCFADIDDRLHAIITGYHKIADTKVGCGTVPEWRVNARSRRDAKGCNPRRQGL